MCLTKIPNNRKKAISNLLNQLENGKQENILGFSERQHFYAKGRLVT